MLDDFVIVSLFLLNAAEMNHVNKDTYLNWKQQLSSKDKYTKIYFVIGGAGQEKVLSVNAELDLRSSSSLLKM